MSTYRPPAFKSFAGQDLAVERLTYAINAAKRENRPCAHTLLNGPPGLGKTTLARIIAGEMGGKLVSTSGPALQTQEELIAVLKQVRAMDVLFVDEIHRTQRPLAERLYPVMEDGFVELFIGEYVKRTKIVRLPPITIIGATTHPGSIPRPMRDRFKIDLTLELYDIPTLISVLNNAGCPVDWQHAIACLLYTSDAADE